MKRREFLKLVGGTIPSFFISFPFIDKTGEPKTFDALVDHQNHVSWVHNHPPESKEQYFQRYIKPAITALQGLREQKKLYRIGGYRLLKAYDIENDEEIIMLDAFYTSKKPAGATREMLKKVDLAIIKKVPPGVYCKIIKA